jgi:hypothetical protein
MWGFFVPVLHLADAKNVVLMQFMSIGVEYMHQHANNVDWMQVLSFHVGLMHIRFRSIFFYCNLVLQSTLRVITERPFTPPHLFHRPPVTAQQDDGTGATDAKHFQQQQQHWLMKPALIDRMNNHTCRPDGYNYGCGPHHLWMAPSVLTGTPIRTDGQACQH